MQLKYELPLSHFTQIEMSKEVEVKSPREREMSKEVEVKSPRWPFERWSVRARN